VCFLISLLIQYNKDLLPPLSIPSVRDSLACPLIAISLLFYHQTHHEMEPQLSLPLIKAFLPKVPLAGKTALAHTFGLSQHSSHWDLRTELTINILRSFIVDSPPEPISKIQKLTLRDPGVKGKLWISRVKLQKPEEDDIRQVLFKAIRDMAIDENEQGGYEEPEMTEVEGEWTGYRAGATKDSRELRCSEEEKYKEMMKEVSAPTTVLYFHGGAYYLSTVLIYAEKNKETNIYTVDPISHRMTCKKIAKLTKGRCLSIRYRLAPQHPFPSALIDALVSYLNLLYPPANSFHTAVAPEHIVFAGDSAGGNLSLVLLLAILQIRRSGQKIIWGGKERDIPLPAGVATCSPWCDITHSSQSCEDNRSFDYLPARSVHPQGPTYPSCSIWPTTPPRKTLYVVDNLLTHPLVSPLLAPISAWENAPPIYISTGTELLTDEGKYVARAASRAGVKVVFEQYETMPHCFAMVIEKLPAARMFFNSWSDFIDAAVHKPETLLTNGKVIKPKTLKEEVIVVDQLSPFTEIEIRQQMKKRVDEMSGKQPDTMAKL
jgi:acetyl esterase/lipase